MREQDERDKITIGLDLGDRRHRFCALDKEGQVIEEGTLGNTRECLGELSSRYAGALIVMEAGCHSPWISRYLEGMGCEVVVSNPRKTRAIYQHERKSDRRDALMLARIARMDQALLYPVRHGSEQAQQDLLRIKLRDSLVRARVGVINSLRFTLKSLGYTIANPSTERFHKVIEGQIPDSMSTVIAPSVRALEELSLRIITTVVNLPKPVGISAGAVASSSALKALTCCCNVSNAGRCISKRAQIHAGKCFAKRDQV